MKGDIVNCRECSSQFQKKRAKHYYCSKKCCNEYNRKKRGDPLPDFLLKKNDSVGKPKLISQPTEGFREIEKNRNQIIYRKESLRKDKRKLQAQHKRILSNNPEVRTFLHDLIDITTMSTGLALTMPPIEKGKLGFEHLLGFVSGVGIGVMTSKMTNTMFAEADQKKAIKKIDEINNKVKNIDFELNFLDTVNEPFVERKEKEFTSLGNKKTTRVTAEELRKMKFKTLYIVGKYSELLGDVSPKFSALVYGSKGSGKSTFCIDLANDLKNYGKVLYISAEEGIGQTLKNKVRLNDVDSPYLQFDTARTANEIQSKVLVDDKFLIIDSVTMFPDLTPQKLKQIKDNFNGSVIVIMQATKDGKYKGDASFGHDVDIVLKVENGSVRNEKNRFSGFGNSIEIFKNQQRKIVNMSTQKYGH